MARRKAKSPERAEAAPSRGRLGRLVAAPIRPFQAMVRQPRLTALSLLSAGLIVLSFPPYDIFGLTFFAYVPLLAVVVRVTPKAAFGWGLLTGVGITAVGFYFILELLQVFGGLPLWASLPLHLLFSVYQGLGIALFAAITSALVRRGRAVVWVAPATYVAVELLCREVFIFPWYLSNATYRFINFLQAADLFGGFGLTWIVMMVNATAFELGRVWLLRRRGRAAPFPVGAAALTGCLVAATLIYGVVRVGQVEAVMAERPTLRIGLVEADVGIMAKANPDDVLNNMLIHQRMSAELEARGADLIIWPETAANPPVFAVSREPTRDLSLLRSSLELVDRVPRDVSWFRPSDAPLVEDWRDDRGVTPGRDIVGIQRGFHTPLLFGALTAREPTADELESIPTHPRRRSRSVIYNTAILIDAQGRVLGTYDKNVLLVFGEYVPLSHFLWKTFGINFYALVPSSGDVAAGRGVTVMELPFETDQGESMVVKIGTMICYEDIIAEYGLSMADLGPNLFINIINDAWFQQSSAAYHHMAFSVMRAVEHRIPLIRSTNTGVSSVIDPVGRIVAQTRLTEAETLLEDVPIMPPPDTVYSHIGDVAGWAACLVVAGLFVSSRWRRTRPES